VGSTLPTASAQGGRRAWVIAAYGFLLGVGLGWLAAGITASVLCWFWPLYVIAAEILGFMIFGGK
jgi:hypothetical protein